MASQDKVTSPPDDGTSVTQPLLEPIGGQHDMFAVAAAAVAVATAVAVSCVHQVSAA